MASRATLLRQASFARPGQTFLHNPRAKHLVPRGAYFHSEAAKYASVDRRGSEAETKKSLEARLCDWPRFTDGAVSDAVRNTTKYAELLKDAAKRNHALAHDNVGVAPTWKQFPLRHIGPRDEEIPKMLKELGAGAESMEAFLDQVIPKDVQLPPKSTIVDGAWDESSFTKMFDSLSQANAQQVAMNGGGYYPVETPPVIRRNILESPAWYTSYTPYQAEISQGRLESLLNFQTMVSDLTGLPIANASLLDEGTAAAEAMTISMNALPASRAKRPGKTFVVDKGTHASTIRVLQGRAEGFGINIKTLDLASKDAAEQIDGLGQDLVGVLVQYPDTNGAVQDFRHLSEAAHKHGVLVSAATDLSALTLLTPPGEWGADIAFGNSQRFGVPMGNGGPHAAFMAVKESLKRRLPGRLVGVSKDRMGRPALRLALQTREQHIRREKATSNVCTAQALLANMAAMYAVWHGPSQLRDMAVRNVLYARVVATLATQYGLSLSSSESGAKGVFSDTVTIKHESADCQKLLRKVVGDHDAKRIDLTFHDATQETTLACVEELGYDVIISLASIFARHSELKGSKASHATGEPSEVANKVWKDLFTTSTEDFMDSLPGPLRRTSSYLTHPVFNSYHSETEMLRYIHHLQGKDLSLTHAMIPLGSCTMKLNATSQMELISHPKHGNIHPLGEPATALAYLTGAQDLKKQLNALTGMDDCSLQPNSGAQGEFAGLRAIRKFHESQPGAKRDICLIPSSAHGTNPASAAMAGMRVVMVKCDNETGNLDMSDLKAKCEKHAEELGAVMITYPSTFGVFEPDIIEICDTVHKHGGQVYMDGANMNAQIGLTSPGALGADVCHLNLHKTFCIPHGGGGPGIGPICVKGHLSPFLPDKEGNVPVASAPMGSASILPISWAYISAMGKCIY